VTSHLKVSVALALCALTTAVSARADEKPVVPLRVQIVIARYQGDKKLTSLPFTLVVNTNISKATLRLGSQVPVTSTSFTSPSADNKTPAPLQSYQYRDVGTNIDCSAATLDEGRFRLDMSIDDSSVYADDPSTLGGMKATGPPSFRRFASTNSLVLRDGQTSQFTVATDKLNGEVTKVDVTLTVVK
jgi:hypothetical protein